jgi:hypothetical protein
MKKFALVFAGFLFSLIAIAQKEINDPNAEPRPVKNFHAIKVTSGIQLMLTQGSAEAVAVSASDNEYRDKIKTEVVDGVLKIYFDNNLWKQRGRDRKLKAYVSFVNLDGLDASAGSAVHVEGSLKVNKLALGASSGAIFNGKVETASLNVDQSSGSVINISGSVGNMEIDGSSGSIFKGYDLNVENCNAETSSGSGVQVTVNKELSVDASSGGYISYKGNGVIRNIKTSSGGNVSKKG